MRCRICGAKLAKDGDICSNCYKEFQEEEELKNDVKEKLKLKRKYSISYEFVKYIEVLILFIFTIIFCFTQGSLLSGILSIIICGAIIGVLLFIDKRIAIGTKAVFYEKKVRYTYNFLFFNTDKIIKYSDIKDITYFQTFRQKKFGYGDLCVYTKSIVPGIGFLNGFQIKNIEKVEEVFRKLPVFITLEK